MYRGEALEVYTQANAVIVKDNCCFKTCRDILKCLTSCTRQNIRNANMYQRPDHKMGVHALNGWMFA